MCRLSSEVFLAAGGGTAAASIATFAKVHWDAIRDRKAFKAAKKRNVAPRDGEPAVDDRND